LIHFYKRTKLLRSYKPKLKLHCNGTFERETNFLETATEETRCWWIGGQEVFCHLDQGPQAASSGRPTASSAGLRLANRDSPSLHPEPKQ